MENAVKNDKNQKGLLQKRGKMSVIKETVVHSEKKYQ